MANLGSLVVSLEANTAKFTSDLGKAAYQTEQAMRKMERDIKIVGAAMGAMAVAGAGSLAVMVKSSLDAMDNMSKLAQKTGVTIESMSGLSYAADMSGVSTEAMGAAMIKLSKNMSDTDRGTGEAIKGFAALDISIKNADGSMKGSDQVISELASKFATFRDGTDKTALAVNLFGESGASLIPLLNSGADGIQQLTAEAAQMGLVMGTDAAKAAEQFSDDLARLEKTQTAFSNAVTVAVLPVLQKVMDGFLGSADGADKFKGVAEFVKATLGELVILGSEVAYVFKIVGNEIGGTAAQLAALARGDFKGFAAIGEAIREESARITAAQAAFIASIQSDVKLPAAARPGSPSDDNRPNAPRILSTPKAPGASKLTDAQKLEADAQKFVARLKEQAETFGKSGIEALQYQLTLSKFPQVYQDQAIAWQKNIDAQKEAADEMKRRRDLVSEEGSAVSRANEEYQALLASMLSNTPSAKLDKQRADVKILADEYEAGRISEMQYMEAVSARFNMTAEKQAKAIDSAANIEYVFTNAFKGMEDSLVSFVTKGKLDFSSLADSIVSDMVRIAVQQSITAPLTGMASGFFGNIFGSAKYTPGTDSFVGPMLPNANGNVFSSPSLSAFSGGIYDTPHTFKFAKGAGVFGEAGPEAIMPLTRGANGKLGVQASGGGRNSMVVNIIESPGNGGRQEQRSGSDGVDVLDVYVEKIKNAIAGDIARGSGSVPNALNRTYGLNRTVGAY